MLSCRQVMAVRVWKGPTTHGTQWSRDHKKVWEVWGHDAQIRLWSGRPVCTDGISGETFDIKAFVAAIDPVWHKWFVSGVGPRLRNILDMVRITYQTRLQK